MNDQSYQAPIRPHYDELTEFLCPVSLDRGTQSTSPPPPPPPIGFGMPPVPPPLPQMIKFPINALREREYFLRSVHHTVHHNSILNSYSIAFSPSGEPNKLKPFECEYIADPNSKSDDPSNSSISEGDTRQSNASIQKYEKFQRFFRTLQEAEKKLNSHGLTGIRSSFKVQDGIPSLTLQLDSDEIPRPHSSDPETKGKFPAETVGTGPSVPYQPNVKISMLNDNTAPKIYALCPAKPRTASSLIEKGTNELPKFFLSDEVSEQAFIALGVGNAAIAQSCIKLENGARNHAADMHQTRTGRPASGDAVTRVSTKRAVRRKLEKRIGSIATKYKVGINAALAQFYKAGNCGEQADQAFSWLCAFVPPGYTITRAKSKLLDHGFNLL